MEGGGGGEIRQRMTFSDQLSLFQRPSNLRDLLKVRDEGEAGSNGVRSSPRPAVTLAAVLASDKNSGSGGSAVSSPRTLLDVLRDEEESRAAAGSSSWRDLTERLRIHHAAASANPPPQAAAEAPTPAAAEAPSPAAAATIRVSLMTLMELREREEEEEVEGVAVTVADVAGEEEEDDVAEARRRQVCCVCMVRKKGAAFIPCGHTFCRVCSRELLAGRGSCPLCNAAISEVLDIF